ncbi:predicted protein [Postia placenta Mad-698-R]|nr:predicted protein [Postia placenta Mad-698-R]
MPLDIIQERCMKHTSKETLWELSTRYCTPCKEKALNLWRFLGQPPPSLTRSNDYHLLLNHCDGWCVAADFYQLCDRWESLEGNPDAQLDFSDTRKAQVAEVENHANLCRQWEKAKAASRAEEVKRLKRDRFQSALDRLRQLGWGDELDLLAPEYKPLTRHEPLRVAHELTDRVWQNIGGGVVAILEDIRDERYRMKHTEILQKRLNALCNVIFNKYSNPPRTVETEYKPHMRDIITMPEIREIVNSSNNAALGSRNEEKPDLFFEHPYNRYMIYEIAAWKVNVKGQPWNSQLLIGPGQRFHERIRTIIKLCGQDPDRTTRQELKGLDVYISYPGQNDKKHIVTLRTAVEEEWQRWTSKSHDESVEYKGRIATEAELADAQRGGKKVPRSRRDCLWCCSLCTSRGFDHWGDGRRIDLDRIQAHMQERHSIKNASEKEGDFYAYPECEMQPF